VVPIVSALAIVRGADVQQGLGTERANCNCPLTIVTQPRTVLSASLIFGSQYQTELAELAGPTRPFYFIASPTIKNVWFWPRRSRPRSPRMSASERKGISLRPKLKRLIYPYTP
jgi:hypothetical protein